MNELRIVSCQGIGKVRQEQKVEYMIRAFVKAGIFFSGWYIHFAIYLSLDILRLRNDILVIGRKQG